jgi:hypothetical protein
MVEAELRAKDIDVYATTIGLRAKLNGYEKISTIASTFL